MFRAFLAAASALAIVGASSAPGGRAALAPDAPMPRALAALGRGDPLNGSPATADPMQAALSQADAKARAWAGALQPTGRDAHEVAGHAATTEDAGVHPPLYMYPLTFGLVSCVILFIYGNRGPQVVLSVMTYLTALSTMKLAVKWVFVEYAFAFPKFVTVLHFASGFAVCAAVLWKRSSASSGEVKIPVPTASELFFVITPIAMAASISIGANNMALGFSSVAFTEIVGSTTCVFTVGTVLLMGLPFDAWLLIPTIAVAMGCAVSTAGEVNFSAFGMILCFASNAFRSIKVTLQQKLMTGESKDKFDPCALLMWVSVPSMFAMLASSLVSEGLEPYRRMAAMDAATLRGLWVAIGISCLNAVILNLAQLFVTKDLGAVGSQLVAQARAVLTVLGGAVLFGDPVTKLELVGVVEVLVGIYAFSAMEARSKERRALELAMERKAPMAPAEKHAANDET